MKFAEFCKSNGFGQFARNTSFYLEGDRLVPMEEATVEPMEDREIIDWRIGVVDTMQSWMNGEEPGPVKMSICEQEPVRFLRAAVYRYKNRGLRLVVVPSQQQRVFNRVLKELSACPMRFVALALDADGKTRGELDQYREQKENVMAICVIGAEMIPE